MGGGTGGTDEPLVFPALVTLLVESMFPPLSSMFSVSVTGATEFQYAVVIVVDSPVIKRRNSPVELNAELVDAKRWGMPEPPSLDLGTRSYEVTAGCVLLSSRKNSRTDHASISACRTAPTGVSSARSCANRHDLFGFELGFEEMLKLSSLTMKSQDVVPSNWS